VSGREGGLKTEDHWGEGTRGFSQKKYCSATKSEFFRAVIEET